MDMTTNTGATAFISSSCSAREFDAGGDGERTSLLIHGEEDRAVGYVLFSHVPDSPSLHLGWIAVEAEHRRCGVGTQLMQRVIDAAREKGAERITLHVRVSNAGAIEFYRELDFGIVRRVEDHYADEDGWRMCLQIR